VEVYIRGKYIMGLIHELNGKLRKGNYFLPNICNLTLFLN